MSNRKSIGILSSPEPPSIAFIGPSTGISRRTRGRITSAYTSEEIEKLENLSNPREHRIGPQRVLAEDEDSMLVSRIVYAARRGFVMDIYQVREAMGAIAKDGRSTYTQILPSIETVR